MNTEQLTQRIEELVANYRETSEAINVSQAAIENLEAGPLTLKSLINARDSLKKIEDNFQKLHETQRTELIQLLYEVVEYVWTHPEKEDKLSVTITRDHHYNDEGLKSDVIGYSFGLELGELLNRALDPFIEDGDIILVVYSEMGRKFSAKEISKFTITNKSTHDEFLKLLKMELMQL